MSRICILASARWVANQIYVYPMIVSTVDSCSSSNCNVPGMYSTASQRISNQRQKYNNKEQERRERQRAGGEVPGIEIRMP